ncbi:tRNA (adenosine(37)-N6)-threonylcarbamoyltransferase complex ATPase subunit type 1 TsaE [Arenicella sp. 4NH20-0111]|uniref:tRNA (adenosine(37)-N6)-threonylcarbamoyltransferase complex ATPase subunit type 1 TsaE n=1 Tax=Arenicella sp. 4NH20-0111 TaxID=3127648 RepID=UPI003107BBAE
MKNEFLAKSIQETELVGREIASRLSFPGCLYLHGQMGSGKTTLTKAILKGLGVASDVTSPTYNLIQEYPVKNGIIYHMDLYRLEEADELEYLALGDLWNTDSLFIVEWPEKGQGHLPSANVDVYLKIIGEVSEGQRNIVLKM